MTVPLLMDVDTGVDDAVALLLAVASPAAELVAATCVAGNVPAPQAAENTLAVLELAGASDVEVALGSAAPLVAPPRTATSHGPRGLGHAELPPPRSSPSTRFAPDLIVDEARRSPGELLLVATGPLTNVALALRREPELPRLLGGVSVMGGAFGHPGNTTPAAEFNVLVDPEAAAAVFAAFSVEDAPRPLVCGLNVTEQAALGPDHVGRLTELAGGDNALVRFLDEALRFKMEALRSHGRGYVAHMHDPLALALALDRTLGATRPGTVDVELAGSLTRGMTVVDWSGLWGRAPNADVAVSVDAERFLGELVELLAGLARRSPSAAFANRPHLSSS
jgi:purine nucleosidase